MISIHPIASDPKKSAHGWLRPFGNDRKLWLSWQVDQITPTLENLSDAISFNNWSPVHFASGYRKAENYLSAEIAALDFDSGKTLDWAIEHFAEQKCIIGTTRNHQKWKDGKAPCDRFRVVLFFDHPVTSKDQYRYNMSILINAYKSDPACKDAGRFFFPCHEIVYTGPENGLTIPVKESKLAERPKELRELPSQGIDKTPGKAVMKLQSGWGFIKDFRHDTIRDACLSLIRYHHKSPDEAFDIVRRLTDKSDDEIRACITYAQSGASA